VPPITPIAVAVTLAATLATCGCTAEQMHSVGPAWQRNQCSGLPDKSDYDRCTARATDVRP
jgi:hypothetical protein